MKKTILLVSIILVLSTVLVGVVGAQTTYTVQSGDSMWKIAVKFTTGISEIISANPQVKNPNMIYSRTKVDNTKSK